jgi:hypothetical protein
MWDVKGGIEHGEKQPFGKLRTGWQLEAGSGQEKQVLSAR